MNQDIIVIEEVNNEDYAVFVTTQIIVDQDNYGKVSKITCCEDGSWFELDKTLGQGAFGKVKLGIRNWFDESMQLQQDKYALKILSKSFLKKQMPIEYGANNEIKFTTNLDKVKKEINVWKQLNCKHIIRLYEVIQDRSHDNIYLVIEFAENGEWLSFDSKTQLYMTKFQLPGKGTEEQAKYLTKSLVLGLNFLHEEKKIAHLDVKPENILIGKDKDN